MSMDQEYKSFSMNNITSFGKGELMPQEEKLELVSQENPCL